MNIVTLLSLIVFLSANAEISETSTQNHTKLSSIMNDTPGKNYLTQSKMVQDLLHGAYTSGFTLHDFIESLEPSHCIKICLDEVHSMLGQPFAGQVSASDNGNLCSHFDVLQRCLHHNTTCKDTLLGVTAAIFDQFCIFDEEAFKEAFPCLNSHSAVIYFTCDNQCRMEEILFKASREMRKFETNILDGSENKLFQTYNLHSLCRASACFINCTEKIVQTKCSADPQTVLHKIVAGVVGYTVKLIPMPHIRSSDAYNLLVSFILPNECQRLNLFSQDNIATTPMAHFIGDMKYGNNNSLIQQKKNSNQTSNSEEDSTNRTIISSNVENQTKPVYTEILLVNGRQMRLQCRMTDLETGQEADIAALLTSAGKNISRGLTLRSVADEEILENDAIFGDRSGSQA